MGLYYTDKGGMRYSTTVGGGGTGWHAHIQVVDDPTKPADVVAGGDKARAALGKTWDWWQGTMASRKTDPGEFARVIIMQRLHEQDLAGRCLDEGGWTHLNLPMRFDSTRACRTPVGGDRRTEDGELLCPQRFTAEAVAETEKDMGPQVAAAQMQQNPSPAKGLIFDRDLLSNEYDERPAGLELVQSWDCAFKNLASSDYVCGQVWGAFGATYYLVDEVHGRMSFTVTCKAIVDMTAKWPSAIAKLVEDKANGTAVIDTLKQDIAGIIPVEPLGGKVARANAVSPLFAAGNVRVPRVTAAPWVGLWREEMASFPMAAHDDRVDATTQALAYLHDAGHKAPGFSSNRPTHSRRG
jgi:predicted phage terminase large subunit-like protein